jgi:hypothetical protein
VRHLLINRFSEGVKKGNLCHKLNFVESVACKLYL